MARVKETNSTRAERRQYQLKWVDTSKEVKDGIRIARGKRCIPSVVRSVVVRQRAVNIPSSSVGVAVVLEEVEPVLLVARLGHGFQVDHGPAHHGVSGEQPGLLVHDGDLELMIDVQIVKLP